MSGERRIVRDGYDEIAAVYTSTRQTDEERFLGLEAELDPDARILDAGCGAGVPVARDLTAHGTVVGVDLSRAQLELASENVPRAAVLQGDITSLPFRDATFDAVVSLHTVIHLPLPDHERAFTEFARVLRPGGWTLLTSGVGAWSGTNPDWLDTGATMRWSFPDRETTLGWLADAGFTVEREAVCTDTIGGGEWLYVLARREPEEAFRYGFRERGSTRNR